MWGRHKTLGAGGWTAVGGITGPPHTLSTPGTWEYVMQCGHRDGCRLAHRIADFELRWEMICLGSVKPRVFQTGRWVREHENEKDGPTFLALEMEERTRAKERRQTVDAGIGEGRVLTQDLQGGMRPEDPLISA